MASPHSATGIWQDFLDNKRAYFMASCACWGGMLFGWDSGLIGGILPRKSFKHSFGLDTPARAADFANLSGWIVSVLQAGCFFGAMSAAFVSDRWGRKFALFFAAFWFHLGSLLQTLPALRGQSPESSLQQLYVGRAIGGFGVGVVSVVVPTYISESSPKHLRGRLTGMYQLAIVFGIAFSFWVNYGLLAQFGERPDVPAQWQIAFALQMLPGALLVITMLTQDESPRWLAEKGRIEESRRVVARLRGLPIDHEVVVQEFNGIKADFEGKERLTLGQQWKVATSSSTMFYRCSLPFIFMAFQQWTGVNSMNYYSPVIFQELGLQGGKATLLGTGIYGIVKIVMTIVVLALGVEQYGRKATLVWGGIGQALPMFYIAAYRSLHSGTSVVPASYIAIVCIYLYVTFYSFGWSVAPWPAMSESVPNRVRSLTMSIGLMSNWLFNFTISKLTPILLAKIKWGTYLLFGCTTMLAVVWALLFYPETGGYAIEEIHALFEGNVMKQSLRDNKYLFSRMQREKTADQIEHAQQKDAVESSGGSEKGEDERYEATNNLNRV